VNTRHLILALGAVLGTVGCTLAPRYARPELPVLSTWPSGPAYLPNETAPAAVPSWQEFLADENLRQVVETALAGNRDLRLAALNVERARALYGVQRDELYPSVQALANGRKGRSSADLTDPAEPRTTEQYSVDFGALSWEIDLFGRIRNLKDQALQEYLATEQARRSVQVLLVASVTDAYLGLAADREGLALAERTLRTQQDAYALVRRQLENDIATELDLRRAQIPVETARRETARYRQRVAQDRNALELLAGGPLPERLLPAGLDQVRPLAAVTPELPSDVLLKRPDILAAEHRLLGAHAYLGAARAAFFPRISLTAALGTASTDLDSLFRSGRGTWNYAPAASMPIFDARTWSAHRVAKVQREIAVTQYEQAIQTAFREVADALAACGTVDRQFAAQQSLVEALAESHRLSRLRFDRGLDSYLGVLDAQRSLFAAQQELLSLRLARFASQVRLYAALGGGWRHDAASSPSQ
jgi:multidrug efflux system outer membrane protein